jgi:GWxTD domain-containing protein
MQYRFSVLTAAALLVTAAIAPPSLPAQEEPGLYRQAQSQLATGDTLDAIATLRELAEAEPDFGPGFLRLGALLSARSSELESDWRQRKEAEKLLREAWRLMGADPELLLEYGLLLRKQLMRVDAERVLNRSWREAVRRGREFDPRQRARLHYELGRIYETWWEDFQDLVMIPWSAQQISCSRIDVTLPIDELASLPHRDQAVLCPEEWAEQLAGTVPLADLRSDDRQRMVDHFRLTMEADSSYADAALRLLGHLADGTEWGDYLRVARRLVGSQPDDPRPHFFLALGYHELGLDRAADSVFARALALLPAGERLIFEDVTPLLTRAQRAHYAELGSSGREEAARIFFTSADPLFLTEVEERRLEHYARLAWAELKFGDPTIGRRGWESDRGEIWLRYGRPWRCYQCCYGVRPRYTYWSYGRRGPVFVFARSLTYRHARLTEVARWQASQLAVRAPELYRPVTVTLAFEMPHQLARFRASQPDLTRVEIYAAPPLDSLEAAPGTSLHAGIFLFDPTYRPLWSHRDTVAVGDVPVGLTYTLNLGTAEYRYGVEARTFGPESEARPAARAREALEIPGFLPGQLSLSDVLLADAMRPLEPSPERREELRIWPSRTLRFGPGAPVHLLFEIYGLSTDDEGLASYRVELAVEDAEQHNVVERVVRGLAELFSRGGAREPRVSWERVVAVTGDRALDYFSVELPELDPGEYLVRLQVTDLATGTTVERERRFRIRQEARPGE